MLDCISLVGGSSHGHGAEVDSEIVPVGETFLVEWIDPASKPPVAHVHVLVYNRVTERVATYVGTLSPHPLQAEPRATGRVG